MAVLYITELESLGTPAQGGNAQIAHMPPVAEQTLAIGSSSAASAAFNSRTRFIRLNTDMTCAIQIAPSATAQAVTGTETGSGAAGTLRLAAGATEYFDVTPGMQVAVIATS